MYLLVLCSAILVWWFQRVDQLCRPLYCPWIFHWSLGLFPRDSIDHLISFWSVDYQLRPDDLCYPYNSLDFVLLFPISYCSVWSLVLLPGLVVWSFDPLGRLLICFHSVLLPGLAYCFPVVSYPYCPARSLDLVQGWLYCYQRSWDVSYDQFHSFFIPRTPYQWLINILIDRRLGLVTLPLS